LLHLLALFAAPWQSILNDAAPWNFQQKGCDASVLSLCCFCPVCLLHLLALFAALWQSILNDAAPWNLQQ